MSATTSKPYAWIRKIPARLAELDSIPLLGNPPSFPWEDFAEKLKQTLEIEELTIQPSEFQWRAEDEITNGMGSPLIYLKFSVSPLEGDLYFAITESDLKLLMSQILLKKGGITPLNGDFQKGFYQFIALEAIHTVNTLGYAPSFTPHIVDESEMAKDAMLCMDLGITVDSEKISGRLFITPNLSKSLKEHYSKEAAKAPFSKPLSEQIEVTLHLEAGSTTLSYQEWKLVQPGDFIILDRCSIKPGLDKGRVMLTLNGHPLFRAKVKDGNVKILEHPLYREDTQTMSMDKVDEDFEDEEDEFDDEDEFDEDDDDFEDDDDDDDDEFDDEDDEFDDEDDEFDDEEENEENLDKKKPKVDQEEEKTVSAHAVPEKKELKIASPEKIPLSVIVEVGRLQMTVQSLMDLKPGNLLELDVHPESGIDLVVNGSRVAKGELLQVGETLGVRILEMG